MRLDEQDCWDRLAGAAHGVLGTVHPSRGVDLVPVVFVLDGSRVLMPIDTVKPKRSTRLRRLANVAADPRATVLVEHYEQDWSRLWWVRLHGHAVETAPDQGALALLGERHPVYRTAGSVASLLVLTPDAVTGWAASR